MITIYNRIAHHRKFTKYQVKLDLGLIFFIYWRALYRTNVQKNKLSCFAEYEGGTRKFVRLVFDRTVWCTEAACYLQGVVHNKAQVPREQFLRNFPVYIANVTGKSPTR